MDKPRHLRSSQSRRNPTSRIMLMRWVLVWKTIHEGDETNITAKARFVAKGFTDPDLTTLRAEAPTLSKASRHMLLQLGASSKFTFEVGYVKTAFLQGDEAEKDRNVFLEPLAEINKDSIWPISKFLS